MLRENELVTRLELPRSNVWLIEAERHGVALVNAGHAADGDALQAALRKRGHDPSEVRRVAYTSWHPDSIGGAFAFPHAQHFLFSPDMRTPRDLDQVVRRQRARRAELAAELGAQLGRYDVQAFESELDASFPSQGTLEFIPLDDGTQLRLGPLQLVTYRAAGPNDGHAAFFEVDRNWMFCGDVVTNGFSARIEDAPRYFATLERLADLRPTWLFPTYESETDRGEWALRRAARFAQNFLSNATTALGDAPTAVEFVERDRGGLPEELGELVELVATYRPLLDEMVRQGLIDADGDGLARRYGIDVEDERAPLRS